jgi:signal peptidase II
VLLTFICAGGLSNLFDRIALGYVTDMISCWSFAVFNVADIAVTCGCIALMIYLIATFKDEEKGDA